MLPEHEGLRGLLLEQIKNPNRIYSQQEVRSVVLPALVDYENIQKRSATTVDVTDVVGRFNEQQGKIFTEVLHPKVVLSSAIPLPDNVTSAGQLGRLDKGGVSTPRQNLGTNTVGYFWYDETTNSVYLNPHLAAGEWVDDDGDFINLIVVREGGSWKVKQQKPDGRVVEAIYIKDPNGMTRVPLRDVRSLGGAWTDPRSAIVKSQGNPLSNVGDMTRTFQELGRVLEKGPLSSTAEAASIAHRKNAVGEVYNAWQEFYAFHFHEEATKYLKGIGRDDLLNKESFAALQKRALDGSMEDVDILRNVQRIFSSLEQFSEGHHSYHLESFAKVKLGKPDFPEALNPTRIAKRLARDVRAQYLSTKSFDSSDLGNIARSLDQEGLMAVLLDPTSFTKGRYRTIGEISQGSVEKLDRPFVNSPGLFERLMDFTAPGSDGVHRGLFSVYEVGGAEYLPDFLRDEFGDRFGAAVVKLQDLNGNILGSPHNDRIGAAELHGFMTNIDVIHGEDGTLSYQMTHGIDALKSAVESIDTKGRGGDIFTLTGKYNPQAIIENPKLLSELGSFVNKNQEQMRTIVREAIESGLNPVDENTKFLLQAQFLHEDKSLRVLEKLTKVIGTKADTEGFRVRARISEYGGVFIPNQYHSDLTRMVNVNTGISIDGGLASIEETKRILTGIENDPILSKLGLAFDQKPGINSNRGLLGSIRALVRTATPDGVLDPKSALKSLQQGLGMPEHDFTFALVGVNEDFFSEAGLMGQLDLMRERIRRGDDGSMAYSGGTADGLDPSWSLTKKAARTLREDPDLVLPHSVSPTRTERHTVRRVNQKYSNGHYYSEEIWVDPNQLNLTSIEGLKGITPEGRRVFRELYGELAVDGQTIQGTQNIETADPSRLLSLLKEHGISEEDILQNDTKALISKLQPHLKTVQGTNLAGESVNFQALLLKNQPVRLATNTFHNPAKDMARHGVELATMIRSMESSGAGLAGSSYWKALARETLNAPELKSGVSSISKAIAGLLGKI